MTDFQSPLIEASEILNMSQQAQVPVAIELKEVQFRWPNADHIILDIPALTIRSQQHLFVRGPSGSGKSTLLSLLTAINTPERGSISLLGTDICQLKQGQRDQFRADNIGYIFQQFNLLPYLSVVDNVCLACEFSSKRKQKVTTKHASVKDPVRREAIRLLTALNLPTDIQNKKASHLSIGQQQRVAAARALMGSPPLVIADEPTSALDHDNREAFIQLLMQEVARNQATLIFVSHDPTLEPLFEQTIDLAQMNQNTQSKIRVKQQGENV
ncbi:MAG: putative ABC transport system ATP-binding protein [Moritella sp.]|jgi:putative ABC transport system ATP-binding protein